LLEKVKATLTTLRDVKEVKTSEKLKIILNIIDDVIRMASVFFNCLIMRGITSTYVLGGTVE